MMRFIRPFTESLPGIDRWGMFSLLVFFLFFVGLIWWVYRMRKPHIDRMRNMPLALAALFGFPSIASAAEGVHFGMSDDNWIVILLSLATLTTLMILAVLSAIRNIGSVLAKRRDKSVSHGRLKSSVFGVFAVFALSEGEFYVLMLANCFLMGYLFVLLSILKGMAKDLVPKRTPIAKPVVTVREPWWERSWRRWNAHVAIAEEEDILLNHAYDGIQELDNKLPPWWINGFYLSMVFSVVYMFVFHAFHYVPMGGVAYEEAMAAHREKVSTHLTSLALNVDENSVRYLLEEERLKQGGALFRKHCTSCHAPDGGGALGPNFTDDYWLHGGGIQDVFKVVKYGVPKNGMRPWQNELSPVQIQNVATFILSLQGSKPAEPKAPQGELYARAVPETE